ncbi:MAG TPA: tyrosine-type recombinase/integrase [Steroidobacteraceae bacterium]|nr:tyrosine-type recombinase/integrase [Steroidobacteraceae bacterium]
MSKQHHQDGNKVRLKHVHVFKTRHGKLKVYFRRPGHKAIPILSPIGSEEFHAEYEAARNNSPRPEIGVTKHNSVPGTWNAAIALYIGSSAYTNLARPEAYRATIAHLRAWGGDMLMRKYKVYQIADLIDDMVKQKKNGAANALSVVTRKVIEIAMQREWITIDLTKGLPKKQKQKNPEGLRPWTEDEVLQWRAAYPDHASMPRRAFELLYATGLRGRSDGTRVGWEHITKRKQDGVLLLSLMPKKTLKHAKWAIIPLLEPDWLECLKHCPADGPFLRNASGNPYTEDHFSLDWRKWAKAAGMADDFRPHGARKMLATDALEMDVSVDDGAKITAHSPAQFRKYGLTARAQIGADRAMKKIVSGRSKRGANLQTSSTGLLDRGKNSNQINV